MTLLRRVVSGLTAAGLLGVSMWCAYIEPHLEARLLDPVPGHGRMGKVVTNRVFSVRVDRVDVAHSIVTRADALNPKNDRRITSPGIFVIAYLSVESRRQPLMLGHVRLTTNAGLHYLPSGRTDLTTRDSGTFEPMLWGKASYLFEIPRDQLSGAHLIVGQSDLLDQLSAETDIDLGLDARSAGRLLAKSTDDYQIRDS